MGVPLRPGLLPVSVVPVLPTPQAATLAVATMAAIRAAVTLGRLMGPSFLAHKRARAAPRAAAHTEGQPLPRAGFGLTAAAEPVAPVGSTWTRLGPLRCWQTGAEVFMPALLGFAGPCTVCSVTPHVQAVDGFRVARAVGRADQRSASVRAILTPNNRLQESLAHPHRGCQCHVPKLLPLDSMERTRPGRVTQSCAAAHPVLPGGAVDPRTTSSGVR